MRLSKPDVVDPNKRRHFEISIDSPFHILSCRASQANTSLPAYTSPQATQQNANLFECGCPGAARRRNTQSSYVVPTLPSLDTTLSQTLTNDSDTSNNSGNNRPTTPTVESPGLTRPPTVHAARHVGRLQSLNRPIHLLRTPSFNPPAFDDEAPPPALVTPPPQYDDIASPTHGLADYFVRLSDAYEDDDDDDEDSNGRTSHRSARSGRVDVPLTPGGRVNRSMDMRRTWVPVGGT